MPKQTVEAIVDGGKASAGPPLGPGLGPTGVNIGEVIAAINEKTKDMAGMKVPVRVLVDTESKSFEVEVGTPPASALIKKELGLEKGSEEPGLKRAGDLKREQASKIARIKFGSDSEENVNQIIGTARSMGVSFEQGEVTQEEIRAYEEAKAAEEAAAEAKAEVGAEEAKPEGEEAAPEGEVRETPEEKGEAPEKEKEKKE